MGIIIKKVSEFTKKEDTNVFLFYNDVCTMPLEVYSGPNFDTNQTICAKLRTGNLAHGRIAGALLFDERPPTGEDLKRNGKADEVIFISRIDVRSFLRGKGMAKGLFKLALEYIEAKYKKPYILKIDKETFANAPKKFGFEDKGSRLYFYKYVE